MEKRNMSKKMMYLYQRLFSRNMKTPIFSTLIFTALFFMIYADTIVSNISSYPPFESIQTFKSKQVQTLFDGVNINDQQAQHQNLVINDELIDDNEDSLKPPENVTNEERIIWFRRKLPEVRILKSNNLTQKFHGRILEFLNHNCTIQFYMTWFAPAKSFGKRELLTIDTLFKSHPQACLMILSTSLDSRFGYKILKPFLDRGLKVLSITPDLPFLVKNTPAETWLEQMMNGLKDPGYVPFSQNLSNLIRLTVLYKYGGVYLDTDFIILRDFSSLRNSIGVQSVDPETKKWTILNNAVLVFDINHPILKDYIEEFAFKFNGNKWGYNGPYLITRVTERLGSTPGYNITILPPQAFYPVEWSGIKMIFKKGDNHDVNYKFSEDHESYGIHLWNKQSNMLKIEEGSVLANIVSNHCLIICDDIYNS